MGDDNEKYLLSDFEFEVLETYIRYGFGKMKVYQTSFFTVYDDEQVVLTLEEYYLRCKAARGRYANKEALDKAIKILDEILDSKTVYTDYSTMKVSDSTAEEFEYARKALQDRRVYKSEMKWFSAGELPTIGPEGMSRYVLAQLKDKRYVVVRLIHFGDEYWNDVEESTSYNLDEIERWRELPE